MLTNKIQNVCDTPDEYLFNMELIQYLLKINNLTFNSSHNIHYMHFKPRFFIIVNI